MDDDWVPLGEVSSSEEASSADEEGARPQQTVKVKMPHLVAVTATAGPSRSSHSNQQSASIVKVVCPVKTEMVKQEMIMESKAAVSAIEVKGPIDLDDIDSPPIKIAKKEELFEVAVAGAQRPFDPVVHELDATFRLTKYADMKGSKIPQETLMKLMEGIRDEQGTVDCRDSQEEQGTHQQNLNAIKIGLSMGASVTALRHPGLCLVQATDFFCALVDDPYMLGKIACAHVLGRLYAIGVTDCDTILMLIAVSTKLTDKERDVVIPLIIRGFKDMAVQAGTTVTGGQPSVNPWLTVGGWASTICQSPEFITPYNAIAGDVLVLTKPLGTHVAVSAHHWLDMPERWNRIKLVISESEVRKGYNRAMDVMARLNRNAARLMHKYNAHGATDITGFGLLGHAINLARCQKSDVSFVIHNLPVIARMTGVAKACGNMFQLLQGFSSETSGGLLIILPRQEAANFCKEIEKQEGYQAWIIGIVEKGNRTARVIDKPRVIEVPSKEKEGSLW